MDTARTFRHRHKTPIGTERVTRQVTDLSKLEALHRFGHQTQRALFQLCDPLYTHYRAFQHRVAQLRQLENTDYGGPLLYAPSQQVRGAVRPDSNHLVIGLTPRGEALLKRAMLWREYCPRTSNKEWKHDFFRNTILSSIRIAAKGCEFIHHDEVVKELGTLTFKVPPYAYKSKSGEWKWNKVAVLRPDGFFALCYPGGAKRIFLIEADCDTEPHESDNIERKNHKHNILAYHSLLSTGATRRPYFGDARVAVLNIFSGERAMHAVMRVHQELLKEELEGGMGAFMLYNHWAAFGDYFRPPPPRPDLFTDPWLRVGQEAFYISRAEQPKSEPVLSTLQPAELRIHVAARR